MAHEGVSRTVFIYGFVTGYARNAMNIEDITYHKDRKVIEHRIKVLNFFDCYGACSEGVFNGRMVFGKCRSVKTQNFG